MEILLNICLDGGGKIIVLLGEAVGAVDFDDTYIATSHRINPQVLHIKAMLMYVTSTFSRKLLPPTASFQKFLTE